MSVVALQPSLWESRGYLRRRFGGGDVVPNGVASAQPDPLGNGPVLLLGLGQLLLDLEGLVALSEGKTNLLATDPKCRL